MLLLVPLVKVSAVLVEWPTLGNILIKPGIECTINFIVAAELEKCNRESKLSLIVTLLLPSIDDVNVSILVTALSAFLVMVNLLKAVCGKLQTLPASTNLIIWSP